VTKVDSFNFRHFQLSANAPSRLRLGLLKVEQYYIIHKEDELMEEFFEKVERNSRYEYGNCRFVCKRQDLTPYECHAIWIY